MSYPVRVIHVKSLESKAWTPRMILGIVTDEAIETLEILPNNFRDGWLVKFITETDESPILRVREYPK